MIVLLPKTDGGVRPIGLFPTVICLWMRARVDVVYRWASLTAAPQIFGGQGMGAQRGAWQETFAVEAAIANDRHYAGTLLDLTKAFELVDHQILADAAERHGSNLSVLRLTVAAYMLGRVIGIDGVYTVVIFAHRGITAGSGSATTELTLMMIGIVFELSSRPCILVKLYVDDLTLSATTPIASDRSSGSPKQRTLQ